MFGAGKRGFLLKACLCRVLGVVSFAWAVALPVSGQTLEVHPDFTVRQWTIRDGLPANNVDELLRTRDGYLWLGTPSGLVRFDGKAFTTFSATKAPALAGNGVVQLVEGPSGHLWISTRPNNLWRYHERQFTAVVSPHPLPANFNAVYSDGADVWVMTTGGLARYVAGALKPYRSDVIDTEVSTVRRDAAGRLWVGTRDQGLYRFDVDGSVRHFADEEGLSSRQINQVFLERDGTPWVATASGGLFRIVEGRALPVLEQGSAAEKVVWCQDDEGHVWFSADEEGWWQYAPSRTLTHWPVSRAGARAGPVAVAPDGQVWRIERVSQKARAGGEPERVFQGAERIVEVVGYVTGVSFDAEGNVWLRASRHGLLRLRRALVRSFGLTEGRATELLQTVLEERAGTLLVGMLGQGLVRVDPSGRVLKSIALPATWPAASQDIFVTPADRTGRVWVGGNGRLCFVQGDRCVAVDTPLPEQLFRMVRAIQADRAGRLWIGGDHGFVLGIPGRDEGWTWTVIEDGPASHPLKDLLEASDGSLFFNTVEGGLYRYVEDASVRDGSAVASGTGKGRFEAFNVAEGLPVGNIRTLYEDRDGFLWITVRGGGLCRFDWQGKARLSEAQVACVDSRSGLPSDAPIGILEDDQGRFWFNSARGIFWVERAALTAFFAGKIPAVAPVSYDEGDGLPAREGRGTNPASLRTRQGHLWFFTDQGMVVIDPARIPRPAAPPVRLEHITVGEATHFPQEVLQLAANQRDVTFHYTALAFTRPNDVRFQYRLDGYDEAWRYAGQQREATYTNLGTGTFTFQVRAGIGGRWSAVESQVIERAPFFWQTVWFATLCLVGLVLLAWGSHRLRLRQLQAYNRVLERKVAARTARIRAREAQLEAQADELRQANEAKSRFLANISHEFRTPLTLTFGPLDDLANRRFASIDFWSAFWPGLTAVVGFWATLSLNIPDFTRYARSQRDQALGQVLGLPATMTLFSFVGIAVTCATVLLFGEAIWDPVRLIGRFSNPLVVGFALFALALATLSTNVAANVVSPANDFANLWPRRITFRTGGLLTGIIGLLIFPWRLYTDLSQYIFTWLIGYGTLLGAVAGIMLADYYVLRRTHLDVPGLYREQGPYAYGGRGVNGRALVALALGILPALPGFLGRASGGAVEVPAFFDALYTYGWFVSLMVAGTSYLALMRSAPQMDPREGRER